MAKKTKFTRRKFRKINKVGLIVFLIISVIAIATLPFSSFFEHLINVEYYNNYKVTKEDKELSLNTNDLFVSFVYVESADAIVLHLPDDKIMLIDSGRDSKNSKGALLEYLEQKIYVKRSDKILDYYIITHPDIDHYGGTVDIMNEYSVKNIYRPNVLSNDEYSNLTNYTEIKKDESKSEIKIELENGDIVKVKTTKTWNLAINAILNEQSTESANIIYNKAGLEISSTDLSNPYKFTFMSPSETCYENSNSYSAVMLLEYKNKKILFAGDATGITESEVLNYANNNGIDLDCDILKVAHHGSNTENTSSADFLSTVKAEYAVISCKEGSYKSLPSSDTIKRIIDSGVAENKLLRTDENGTIVVGFDSSNGLLVIFDNEKAIVFIHWYYIVFVVIFISGSVLFGNILIKNENKPNNKKKSGKIKY